MRVDCFPEAPTEWPRKTVGELAEIDPPYLLEDGKAYPFVEMASVREGFGGIDRFDQRIWDRSGLCRFKENDLMLGKITPCAENGKAALVRNLPDSFGIGSTEFFVLSPKDGVVAEFLFAAVTAGAFHRRLVSRMEGSTGRLRITRDTLKKWLTLPVPQPDEQRRISAALKLADEAINKAREELDATRDLKRSLITHVFERGMIAGVPTKPCKIHRSYTAHIPAHWDDDKLGKSLVLVEYGTNAASNDYRGGYPVIAIPQVVAPHLTLTDVPFAEVPETEASALRLLVDDVLLIRTNGNPEYIGKSTIVSSEVASIHTIYASYLIRLRSDKDRLLGAYLNYFLASPLGRRQAGAVANTSAGNNNIGARAIKQFRFPRPPLVEQERVVVLLDGIENQINAQSAKVNAAVEVKRSLLQNLLTGKIRIPEGMIHA